ncbi:hypothetical protein DERP_013454 [Dermatophagoides pteronyssinus]|uniref:Uncharacterized protein n=1 Tax=Dermatophagoides pteronyssinus TaxID=6956 RepID=A0ABQ8JS72_DERPT|nr:hypothetical protein DERP_013454 [Dermatophagoides pteronyssinus]
MAVLSMNNETKTIPFNTYLHTGNYFGTLLETNIDNDDDDIRLLSIVISIMLSSSINDDVITFIFHQSSISID